MPRGEPNTSESDMRPEFFAGVEESKWNRSNPSLEFWAEFALEALLPPGVFFDNGLCAEGVDACDTAAWRSGVAGELAIGTLSFVCFRAGVLIESVDFGEQTLEFVRELSVVSGGTPLFEGRFVAFAANSFTMGEESVMGASCSQIAKKNG